MPRRASPSFPPPAQTIFWTIVLIITVTLIWLLGSVMAPFITGMAIAYLLNPAVTAMGRRLPRSLSCLIVLAGFALVVTAIITSLSPIIGRQMTEFSNNMPQYIDRLYDLADTYFAKTMGRIGPENAAKVKQAAGDQVGTVLTGLQSVLLHIWSGGMAVIDIITFMVITPVVAFYCMRDWPHITKKVENLFPRRNARMLRGMMHEFNMRLAGFVRGQLLVCFSLGVMYAITLTLVGLNFGLVIGMLAGLLTFIPYLGTVFGFVSSVGVALIQYPDYKMPMVVVAIFFIGQFIEGNIMAPKLVGERIGLHPVWVIFALMAGGKLFGFTGLLLAVPVAAMLGVVVRRALNWYQHSPAYLDAE